MTAQELIDKLKTYPPETMVVVDGYEGGCGEPTEISLINIKLNQNTEWYYGKHEVASKDKPFDTQAILISG